MTTITNGYLTKMTNERMDNVANKRTTKRASVELTDASTSVVPSLETSKGWDKLSGVEKDALRTETNEVIKAVQLEAQSKLAIGEHLTKIQDILGPKRLFVSFVDHNFGWSRATAYRYIDMYKVGKRLLPEPVLEVAIARGTPIKEEVIKNLPPPNSTNESVIRQYLETVENQPSAPVPMKTDYQALLKESFNFVILREQRVEGNQRTKDKWHRDFIGMLLSKWGIKATTAFSPVTIPDSMLSARGRPKLQQQVAA